MTESRTTLFENLAFDGAGVTFVAYSGALKQLADAQNKNLFSISDIKHVSGASSGSMVALLVSKKTPPDELVQTSLETDFKQFEDSTHLLSNLHRLYTKGGFYEGDQLEQFIKTYAGKNAEGKDVTFRDLKEAGFKDLAVLTTKFCLINKKPSLQPMIFSLTTTPDTTVANAVRASCALPGYFPGVRLKEITSGQWVKDEKEGDVFIDGGLISSVLPIDLFDPENQVTQSHLKTEIISPQQYSTDFLELLIQMVFEYHRTEKANSHAYRYNNKTLGLQISSALEINHFNHIRNKTLDKSTYNFNDFIKRFENIIKLPTKDSSYSEQLRSLLYDFLFWKRTQTLIQHAGIPRTIFINNLSVSSTDFALTTETIKALINSGAKAVTEQLSLVAKFAKSENYKNHPVKRGEFFSSSIEVKSEGAEKPSRCCFG